jgi:hypothetical protein
VQLTNARVRSNERSRAVNERSGAVNERSRAVDERSVEINDVIDDVGISPIMVNIFTETDKRPETVALAPHFQDMRNALGARHKAKPSRPEAGNPVPSTPAEPSPVTPSSPSTAPKTTA